MRSKRTGATATCHPFRTTPWILRRQSLGDDRPEDHLEDHLEDLADDRPEDLADDHPDDHADGHLDDHADGHLDDHADDRPEGREKLSFLRKIFR
jgi:hypothetical protein